MKNEQVQGIFLTMALLFMGVAYLYPDSGPVFFVALVLAFVCGVVPRFTSV